MRKLHFLLYFDFLLYFMCVCIYLFIIIYFFYLFIFYIQNLTQSTKDLYPNEGLRLQNIPNAKTHTHNTWYTHSYIITCMIFLLVILPFFFLLNSSI